ncbi:MAG: hypothetical protein ACRCT0_00170 [Plesiomonas shigelloides]
MFLILLTSSTPVHPLHQLFVMFSLEQFVALVKHVHVLVVCHQLTDFLRNLHGRNKEMILLLDEISLKL